MNNCCLSRERQTGRESEREPQSERMGRKRTVFCYNLSISPRETRRQSRMSVYIFCICCLCVCVSVNVNTASENRDNKNTHPNRQLDEASPRAAQEPRLAGTMRGAADELWLSGTIKIFYLKSAAPCTCQQQQRHHREDFALF